METGINILALLQFEEALAILIQSFPLGISIFLNERYVIFVGSCAYIFAANDFFTVLVYETVTFLILVYACQTTSERFTLIIGTADFLQILVAQNDLTAGFLHTNTVLTHGYQAVFLRLYEIFTFLVDDTILVRSIRTATFLNNYNGHTILEIVCTIPLRLNNYFTIEIHVTETFVVIFVLFESNQFVCGRSTKPIIISRNYNREVLIPHTHVISILETEVVVIEMIIIQFIVVYRCLFFRFLSMNMYSLLSSTTNAQPQEKVYAASNLAAISRLPLLSM